LGFFFKEFAFFLTNYTVPVMIIPEPDVVALPVSQIPQHKQIKHSQGNMT